ncbi:hypothetical protein RIF29_42273 [Crotalaria pallida]|uniref:Uncharacterized protein n=1 Tax=Crotalaria pallida TaxID=3830 RepID=A0AAN9EC60_CROPI
MKSIYAVKILELMGRKLLFSLKITIVFTIFFCYLHFILAMRFEHAIVSSKSPQHILGLRRQEDIPMRLVGGVVSNGALVSDCEGVAGKMIDASRFKMVDAWRRGDVRWRLRCLMWDGFVLKSSSRAACDGLIRAIDGHFISGFTCDLVFALPSRLNFGLFSMV